MMNRINDRIQAILSGSEPLRDRLRSVTKAHLEATFRINLDAFMQGAKDTLSTDQIEKMQEAEERMYKGIEQVFRMPWSEMKFLK